jgi:sec-independent protein translocase protein TatC
MSTEAVQMRGGSGDDGRMSLMDHLGELRGRLIKSVIAIVIGAAIGWVLYPWVLHALTHPLREIETKSSITGGRLLLTDPLEGFFLRIKISAYIGIGLAMPYVLWQLWRFVSPGLYSNERKYAVSFVASASLLFAAGAAIAFWTLPKALQFLQSVSGGSFAYGYSGAKYLTLIVYMMLAFGGGFEFPILLIFLQLVGVLDSKKLRGFRRYGIVIIFVVAAVITPSADPISLFALAIPMCIFYEISILFGRIRERRERKAQAAS